MGKHVKHSCHDEEDGHPSTDTTLRFSIDQLLRLHGWRIHSRHRDREPVWERHGALVSQADALAALPPEELRKARQREGLYRTREVRLD